MPVVITTIYYMKNVCWLTREGPKQNLFLMRNFVGSSGDGSALEILLEITEVKKVAASLKIGISCIFYGVGYDLWLKGKKD